MLTKSSVVLGAVAIALIAAAPARAAKIENLNNLGKESYFAYVEKAVGAKSQPKTTAKTVGKLRLKNGIVTNTLTRDYGNFCGGVAWGASRTGGCGA